MFLLEGREFLKSRDAVSVHPVAIAGVFLALALEIVALLAAALVRRDALHLSERGRRACVYGAEALLALTVAHARVTMPWLFHGFISRYWPFVVMAIAYLGIGLSAMFRRQGRSVLAEPLDRTAIFLPVVPVIGFWVVGPEAYQVHYSWVLVFVGVLYGFLSLARKSVLFGLLATAASNGALWYLWSRAGLGFAEHPQVWLAPLALSVLGASYLNRRQIPEPRQATIRYTCLMFLYLSSTADIFVAGVAESPWLPMVLAVWSVLGVFAGILLRVRSYLFAGSTFLLISLVTLVWHAAAAQGWTWLWYVAGIALGLGIIVFFALFERRRAEMVRLIDGLKEWDA